jgi:hypothetical protein
MTFGIILAIIFVGIFLYYVREGYNQTLQQNQAKAAAAEEEKKNVQSQIRAQVKRVDQLSQHIADVGKIQIPEIGDYKNIIIINEKLICEKGGDTVLFNFMKLDSFLNEYREQVIKDKKQITTIDVKGIKSKITSEANREHDIYYLQEKMEERVSALEGRGGGWEYKLDKLFRISNQLAPTLQSQISTLDFYKNMGIAMYVFYVNDNKIRYYEIFQAFEQLGVFDSTWQKNVLSKLGNIEERLQSIDNSLVSLNDKFQSLVQSNEKICDELKSINSSIVTGNMLQAFTAYQTWKSNKG